MAITSAYRYQRGNDDDQLPVHESSPPEFGVALFDLEDENAGGACYSTAGGYQRFRSSGDLSNTTLWVTNIGKIAQGMHNLRFDAFLSSKLNVIAADLGVELAGFKQINGRDKGGMVDVATALTRTRDLATAAYKWRDPDVDWKYGRFSEAISEILLPRGLFAGDRPPAALQKALKGSYQAYSSPPNKAAQTYDEGSRHITLRRNRVQHAMEILRTPLPHDGWGYVKDPQPLDFWLDPARPSLVNLQIEWCNATPEQVNLIAFGSDIGKQTMRRWVSQVELMWLLGYARVNVIAGYVPNGARTLPESLQLPAVVGGDFCYWMSLAAGLVAESHWKGLATPKWDSRKRMTEETPACVFLRAMDRMISFQMALAAHEAGASVLGYGGGGVSMRVQNMGIDQLLEIADTCGATHPCLAAESVSRERGDW